MRCATSLAILDPFPPMAKVTAVTTVFPYTGLLRFLLRSENRKSDEALKQIVFRTENARMLSESAVFAPWAWLPQRWVAFRVVTQMLTFYWALGPRCAETTPRAEGRSEVGTPQIGALIVIVIIFITRASGATMPKV